MRKIVLTFGLISGAILAAMTAITLPLSMKGTIDFDKAEIIGYTSMVLAFLMVFFGIRSYRDNVNGRSITFGKAFKVGILISLITCAVYVISWEIVYFSFTPQVSEHLDRYATHVIEKMRAKGATDAEIAEQTQQLAHFRKLYANPFINVAMTFMEVFPVGLIVTLVSAAILRRKSPPTVQAAAVAIA